MGELVCPACRHATRKHGEDGCMPGCWCDMTPARINGTEPAPEPAAAAESPAIPAGYVEAPAITGLLNHVGIEGRAIVPAEPAAPAPAPEPVPTPPRRRSTPATRRRPKPEPPEPRPFVAPALERAAAAVGDRIKAALESAAPEVLGRWDSWWCNGCGARRFEGFDCCGSAATAVTVTMTRREVSR